MKKETRFALDQLFRGYTYMQHSGISKQNINYYLQRSPGLVESLCKEIITEEDINNLPVIKEARKSMDDYVKLIVFGCASSKKNAGIMFGKELDRQIVLDDVLSEMPEHLRLALMAHYGSLIEPQRYGTLHAENARKVIKEIEKALPKKQIKKLKKIMPGVFQK